MRLEHLYGLDLSLLVVLAVLLEERSVTRSARRIGRSQPAISRALQRLRDLLDDPLFVRESGGLEPTPRALALRAPLLDALGVLERQVLSPTTFDPAHDDRELRIVSTDFAEGSMLPRPLADLSRAAPRIDVVLVSAPTGWSMADVLRQDAHLALSPIREGGASVRSVGVGKETFVVLLRPDHPEVDGLDLATYASLPHLLVAPGGTPGGVVDDALERQGLRRRVAMRTRHFQTAPELVAASDLIATLPRRFAQMAAQRFGLVLREPPLPLPPFDMKVAWHERWHHDAGHRWIRERLVASLRAELASA